MVTDGSLATPDPPASGVSADAEPQRGQARTGQSEDGEESRDDLAIPRMATAGTKVRAAR